MLPNLVLPPKVRPGKGVTGRAEAAHAHILILVRAVAVGDRVGGQVAAGDVEAQAAERRLVARPDLKRVAAEIGRARLGNRRIGVVRSVLVRLEAQAPLKPLKLGLM